MQAEKALNTNTSAEQPPFLSANQTFFKYGRIFENKTSPLLNFITLVFVGIFDAAMIS